MEDPLANTDERGKPRYGQHWGYCEPWCTNSGGPLPSIMQEVKLDTLTDEEE